MNVRNRLRPAALAAAVLLLAGCAGEIGVTRVGAAGRAEYAVSIWSADTEALIQEQSDGLAK